MSPNAVSHCVYVDLRVSNVEQVATPMTANGKCDGRRRDREACDRGSGCVGKLRCIFPLDKGFGRNRAAKFC